MTKEKDQVPVHKGTDSEVQGRQQDQLLDDETEWLIWLARSGFASDLSALRSRIRALANCGDQVPDAEEYEPEILLPPYDPPSEFLPKSVELSSDFPIQERPPIYPRQ